MTPQRPDRDAFAPFVTRFRHLQHDPSDSASREAMPKTVQNASLEQNASPKESRRQHAQATFRRVRFGLRADCPERVLAHVEAARLNPETPLRAFLYPVPGGRKAVLIAAPRPTGPARQSPEGGAA